MLVALLVFGPRRLPELARSLGKSLNEFKRASDDFKRTWEREAALEGAALAAADERTTDAELSATLSPLTEYRDALAEAPRITNAAPPRSAAFEGGSHVETPALAANV